MQQIKEPTRDWKNPSYLETGNERQRHAYAALLELKIFSRLAPFDPVLTGTIPIGIDIETSDLDIVCRTPSPTLFQQTIRRHYHRQKDFTLTEKTINEIPSTIARFRYKEFLIEIFGQPLRVEQQAAYRHMVVEHKILEQKGEAFKAKIIALKTKGTKTEPAFAHCLGLTGDPYAALLKLE